MAIVRRDALAGLAAGDQTVGALVLGEELVACLEQVNPYRLPEGLRDFLFERRRAPLDAVRI